MGKQNEATLLLKIKQTGVEVLDKVKKAMSTLKDIAIKVGVALAATGTAIGKLAVDAAKFEDVQKSFSALAKSQGQDAEAMLKNMKELSKGTISDMELMQKANSALLLGLPVDKFDEMLEIARSASKATGESMDYMLDSIVTGLGRGSKLMLDNLGIVFKLEDAHKEYAEALGKTAAQLTEAEKKQAFINKAIETGLANSKALGEQSISLADNWEQVKTTLENAAIAFGQKLLPVMEIFAPVIKKVADNILEFAKSDEAIEFAKGLGKVIVKVTTFFRDLASAAGIGVSSAFEAVSKAIRLDFGGAKDAVTKGWDEMSKAREKHAKQESAILGKIETAHQVKKLEKEKINLDALKQEVVTKKQEEVAEVAAIEDTKNIEKEAKHKEGLAKKKDEELKVQKEIEQEKINMAELTNTFVTSGAKGAAESILSTYVNSILPGFGGAAGEIFNMFSQNADAFEKQLRSMFSADFVSNIADNLATLPDLLPEILDGLVESFPDIAAKLIESIISSLPKLVLELGKALAEPGLYLKIAEGILKGIMEGMASLIQDIVKEIKSMFAFTSGGESMVSKAKSGVKKFFGLAEGGVVMPTPGGTPAIIGEGGRPEAVIPLDKLGNLTAGGGGNTINLTVNGGLLGDESSAKELARAIDQQLLELRQGNESVSFDAGVV